MSQRSLRSARLVLINIKQILFCLIKIRTIHIKKYTGINKTTNSSSYSNTCTAKTQQEKMYKNTTLFCCLHICQEQLAPNNICPLNSTPYARISYFLIFMTGLRNQTLKCIRPWFLQQTIFRKHLNFSFKVLHTKCIESLKQY